MRAALNTVLGSLTQKDTLEVVDCADDTSLDAARRRLLSEVVWPSQEPPLYAYLARHPAATSSCST